MLDEPGDDDSIFITAVYVSIVTTYIRAPNKRCDTDVIVFIKHFWKSFPVSTLAMIRSEIFILNIGEFSGKRAYRS